MEIKNEDSDCEVDLQSNSKVLPGFRFHPTEEELVGFYLRRKVERKPFKFDLIEVVELCNYDPWDLPGLADRTRDREWFFFVPRDARHQGHGGRPNRMTVSGYWKATGTDRRIYGQRSSDVIGLKKTLVFYIGKAPKGQKTDWIMNEYRLARSDQLPTVFEGISTNEFTLCRVYKKAGISITSFDRRPRIEVEHRELMASSSCKPRHFQISMSSKDTVSGIDSASPNKLQLGASAIPTAEHRLNSANAKPTFELLTQIQGTSTRCLSDPIDENTFPSLEEKNNEAISSAMTEDLNGHREINGRLLPCLTHVNSFDRWCSELISWMPSPNGSSPLWNPPV